MLYGGVDAGSRTIKVVLVDAADGRVSASGICDQGVRQSVLTKKLFDKVLSEAGLKKDEIANIIATGYGRDALDWADTTVTEITCQARGIKHHAPDVRTIIDIGGQDSKLIRLDRSGIVHDFAMNDRCAAGTGRFLEIVAQRLGVKLKDIGAVAEKADHPAVISSTCVVFAETEIVGLLASEASLADLAAGVQDSIAKRIGAMAGPRIEGPIVFTGGVALIPGMRKALSRVLGKPVRPAKNPQMTAALGAALIAAE
ncbi:MAG: acyl-CoA dehydratase activase [Elusimicrobiota bacterium]